jgi:hypothetical protein
MDLDNSIQSSFLLPSFYFNLRIFLYNFRISTYYILTFALGSTSPLILHSLDEREQEEAISCS